MSTLYEQYLSAVTGNEIYNQLQDRWQFYLDSYLGGEDYRSAGHLTRYLNETDREYQARLMATPLDNHCKSVISVYTSFLFREHPDRDFGDLIADPMLEDFVRDADLDGRSLDNFMKEVSIWSNVFGHCWILLSKANVGAETMADELAMGVRPYASMLTPLTVMDWSWKRSPMGAYTLDRIKYVEDVNGDEQVIKEWTAEFITTYVVNTQEKSIQSETVEINGLGRVPAVICYGSRGPVRGVGISDLADIADQQKKIYNEYSEVEQSIRLNGHPALVKTPDVEASAGAGAIIQMPDNLDPGLKPYILSVSTDISAIYNSISNSVSAIDKMANTGAVRSTQASSLSGVAMETEFQLLNARLSEKADNLELAEEQLWKLYAEYQAQAWQGRIEYPDSFNIPDDMKELQKLSVAKSSATDPRVFAWIDHEILEAIGGEADMIIPEIYNPEAIPEKKPFEPHYMIDLATGEKYIARTEAEHLAYAAQGYVHEMETGE